MVAMSCIKYLSARNLPYNFLQRLNIFASLFYFFRSFLN